MHAEGERVLKALAPGERVVLLDERGRDLTSQAMAQLIAQVGALSQFAFVGNWGAWVGWGGVVPGVDHCSTRSVRGLVRVGCETGLAL